MCTLLYIEHLIVYPFPVELNMLGLRPRTFNCQLENVKSQKVYTFNFVTTLKTHKQGHTKKKNFVMLSHINSLDSCGFLKPEYYPRLVD